MCVCVCVCCGACLHSRSTHVSEHPASLKNEPSTNPLFPKSQKQSKRYSVTFKNEWALKISASYTKELRANMTSGCRKILFALSFAAAMISAGVFRLLQLHGENFKSEFIGKKDSGNNLDVQRVEATFQNKSGDIVLAHMDDFNYTFSNSTFFNSGGTDEECQLIGRALTGIANNESLSFPKNDSNTQFFEEVCARFSSMAFAAKWNLMSVDIEISVVAFPLGPSKDDPSFVCFAQSGWKQSNNETLTCYELRIELPVSTSGNFSIQTWTQLLTDTPCFEKGFFS